MVLPRTPSIPLSSSTLERREPFLQAVTSSQARLDTRPSWVTSWSVQVSALPVLSHTTISVTMMERTSLKTNASSQRKFQRVGFLTTLLNQTLFFTPKVRNPSITMSLSSTSPSLETPSVLSTSTHLRSLWEVLTLSPHTTSAKTPSSLFPSWLTWSFSVRS